MKKILSIIAICIIGVLAFTGCTKEKNIEGSLPEIMDKLYEGIKDEEKPMMLSNIEIDDESFEYYTFIKTEYKEPKTSEMYVIAKYQQMIDGLVDEILMKEVLVKI